MEAQLPGGPAFEAAYRENFDRTAQYAANKGATQTGEDVAQEAMIRMLRQGEAFDYEGRTAAWLRVTAERIVIDNHRAAQARPQSAPEEFDMTTIAVPSRISAVHHAMLAGQALDAMSEQQRAVITLTELEGYSLQEAADKIGIPIGTVKSSRHYGLRIARAALRKIGITAADV